MKVQPRVPGIAPATGAEGPAPSGGADAARGFAAAVRAGESSAAGPAAGIPADALERVAARYAAGEITRADAAAQVAAETVKAWPAEAFGEAERAQAAGELADVLAEDPTFAALLDAAAGGSR
jgi:hypothetical protein